MPPLHDGSVQHSRSAAKLRRLRRLRQLHRVVRRPVTPGLPCRQQRHRTNAAMPASPHGLSPRATPARIKGEANIEARRRATVPPRPSLFAAAFCPSNTRDQLRGAHDLTLVHDDRADNDASTRLQPPLVSCIALFDAAVPLLIAARQRGCRAIVRPTDIPGQM